MQSRGRSSSSVALTEASSGSTQLKQRVLGAIERLASDPHSAALRRLAGRPESRLRVGDWRVIVELDIPERTIVIARVLRRERAYDR